MKQKRIEDKGGYFFTKSYGGDWGGWRGLGYMFTVQRKAQIW